MRQATGYLAAALGAWCSPAPLHALESAGAAVDAQPGFHRVGIAEGAVPTLAGTVGYGFTEPQRDAAGAHHRLSLSLAGAAAPVGWLSVAPAFGVRHDLHAGDSSNVVDGSFAARVFAPWQALRLGAELELWVPGAEEASALPDTLSPEARGLVGAKLGQTRLGFHFGYRRDRSANAAPNAATLGPGDRVALGVSSFDALLLGAAAGVTRGNGELFGELSADVLVGRGAPSFTQSPLRATAGVRYALSSSLAAALVTDVSLSRRPGFEPSALVPIEPRLSLLAGIRYRFVSTEETKPGPTRDVLRVAPKPPPMVPKATLELVVVDEEGAPVPNVKVALTIGSTTRELALDASGHYRDEQAPVGAARLSFSAKGFEPAERSVVLEVATPQKLEVALRALPPPSQVRGSVRSLGGVGLSARVRVDPLGLETATNDNGEFTLDVPPGSYEVSIEAEGYEGQRRKVTVEPKNVVILNAELTKPR
jgi:hypothetical protein